MGGLSVMTAQRPAGLQSSGSLSAAPCAGMTLVWLRRSTRPGNLVAEALETTSGLLPTPFFLFCFLFHQMLGRSSDATTGQMCGRSCSRVCAHDHLKEFVRASYSLALANNIPGRLLRFMSVAWKDTEPRILVLSSLVRRVRMALQCESRPLPRPSAV